MQLMNPRSKQAYTAIISKNRNKPIYQGDDRKVIPFVLSPHPETGSNPACAAIV